MRTIRSFGLILIFNAVFIGFSPLAEAYVGGTWVTYTTQNSELGSNDVRAICPDSFGNIWFGTANGLSKFDGVSWKTYTTADKLANNMVNAIACENGAVYDLLWVGTDGGVTAVNVKPGVVVFSVPFTAKNTQYPGMISESGDAAPKTFTNTPSRTSSSPHVISETSSPALTNPASINYTVTNPLTTISVDNVSLYWSRDNVYVNGSSYALMLTPGSYLKTNFSGTFVAINLDVSKFWKAGVLAVNYPIVRYQIDGGAWTSTQLTSTTTALSVSGLSSGTHSLRFEYISFDPYGDVWNSPINALKVTSLSLDDGATVSIPTILPRLLRVDGDSITEGLRAIDTTDTPAGGSAVIAYPYLLAGLLNTELTKLGYGSQGWVSGWLGNIPTYPEAVDYYYNGVSRLSGGVLAHAPDYWLIAQGTNDHDSDISSLVQTRIGQARIEAGAACQIFVVIPFCGAEREAITSNYNAYIAANPSDTKVHLIDLGAISYGTTDGTHPNAAGHQTIATALAAAINTALESISASPSDKILAVAVDSQHVRWFGTEKGLMSFNGTVWKVYTTADKLAHNQVNAIAYEETKYGPEIWVATAGGISVVNTSIDAVTFATPYTTTNTKYPGMISDLIQSATMDSIHNMRWFGTDKGVIGFDGKVFISFTMNDFLPDNDVTSAALGLDGMVYFGTRHGGVSRFDGVSGASPLDTMWSGIASNTIRAIAVGKFGALWFATDQGVTKWIPEGLGVDGGAEHPVAAAIHSVFPNPFNPSTTIEFSLARNGRAVLAVYNLSGQKVREFLSGAMSAGLHTVKWDGRDRNGAMVSSGTYIIQLRMDNTVVNRKITLAK